LRLLDELKNQTSDSFQCYGREEEEQNIVELLTESEESPSYLYISGPNGIGRRTIASQVYRKFFPHISKHKIEINLNQFEDDLDIYRKVLAYSANWRASDYKNELDQFLKLIPKSKSRQLAALLKEISTKFAQVVVINLGTAALTEEGKPQTWFSTLAEHLSPSDYPYVWFISQRFLNGSDLQNGLFLSIDPLNEKRSTFLFRILIKQYTITIPSRDEQSRIETCISGHPGLICMVANYLKSNPHYKPNRTHNNIVKLINEQVQTILYDFVGTNIDRERAVAFFAEADIMSYAEIQDISNAWPAFEVATAELIDAGLLIRSSSDYSLVSYIKRATEGLKTQGTFSTIQEITFGLFRPAK
jgi:hypothetical protein